MTRSLSDLILEFIGELRAARIRISVAESIDAMNAVAAAGEGIEQLGALSAAARQWRVERRVAIGLSWAYGIGR